VGQSAQEDVGNQLALHREESLEVDGQFSQGGRGVGGPRAPLKLAWRSTEERGRKRGNQNDYLTLIVAASVGGKMGHKSEKGKKAGIHSIKKLQPGTGKEE